jgi:tRNA (guanine-N7-)-methyltransferase
MRYLSEADLPDIALTSQLSRPALIVELEIGSSVGSFLIPMALKYPERYFVGVELKHPSSHLSALRAARKSLNNGVVINIEAYNYLTKWVPDNAFDVIHIYFPTPFETEEPRLFTAEFVAELFRVLKSWGTLRLVTDHKEYYEQICQLFATKRWWSIGWTPVGLDIPNGFHVGTGHEMTFRRDGAEIYTLQMIRVG